MDKDIQEEIEELKKELERQNEELNKIRRSYQFVEKASRDSIKHLKKENEELKIKYDELQCENKKIKKGIINFVKLLGE